MKIELQPGDAALVFRQRGDGSIHEAYLATGSVSDSSMWVMFFSWMASDEAGEDALVGPLITDIRRAFAVRLERNDPKLLAFFQSHSTVPIEEEKPDASKQ